MCGFQQIENRTFALLPRFNKCILAFNTDMSKTIKTRKQNLVYKLSTTQTGISKWFFKAFNLYRFSVFCYFKKWLYVHWVYHRRLSELCLVYFGYFYLISELRRMLLILGGDDVLVAQNPFIIEESQICEEGIVDSVDMVDVIYLKYSVRNTQSNQHYLQRSGTHQYSILLFTLLCSSIILKISLVSGISSSSTQIVLQAA